MSRRPRKRRRKDLRIEKQYLDVTRWDFCLATDASPTQWDFCLDPPPTAKSVDQPPGEVAARELSVSIPDVPLGSALAVAQPPARSSPAVPEPILQPLPDALLVVPCPVLPIAPSTPVELSAAASFPLCRLDEKQVRHVAELVSGVQPVDVRAKIPSSETSLPRIPENSSSAEDAARLRAHRYVQRLRETSKEATLPVQLPADIYTSCAKTGLRWDAILEYADERHGAMYKQLADRKRIRCVYVVRITGARRLDDATDPERDCVPTHQRHLIGKVVLELTRANGLIKGASGVKHTESGWEAWKTAANGRPLKEQKRRFSKVTGAQTYLGGGFLNRTSRTPEMARDYRSRNETSANTPDTKLPPLTADEERAYWYGRCGDRGSAKDPSAPHQPPKKKRPRPDHRPAALVPSRVSPCPPRDVRVALPSLLDIGHAEQDEPSMEDCDQLPDSWVFDLASLPSPDEPNVRS